ncbi:MAG: hypothetical protein WC869_01290 [Phycisphaerae bacterium]|jgi:hypothetical protein
MSDNAPAGYINMTARSIKDAIAAAQTKTKQEHEQWVGTLASKLLAWRHSAKPTRGFWRWLDMATVPKDPEKLTKWYRDQWCYVRPKIEGIADEPSLSWKFTDWERRMKNVSDDTIVFIDIDDAAMLKKYQV